MLDLKYQSDYNARKLSLESPEESIKRKASAVTKDREKRQKETEEERNARLKYQSDYRARKLSLESPEESIKRKASAVTKDREKRQKETEEERNARLKYQSDYKARKLSLESPEESIKRKASAVTKDREKRQKETEEDRNARLKYQSDYKARKLSLESPEESIKRKASAVTKDRENRQKETEEERNDRLKYQSDYRLNEKEARKSHLFSISDYSEKIKIEKISSELKEKILNNLREKLGGQFLDEGVCIVCDRITLRSSMTTKSWSSVLTTEQQSPGVNDDNLDNIDDSNDNVDENNVDPNTSLDDSNNNVDDNSQGNNVDPNSIFYAMKKMLSIPNSEKLSASLIADYDCSEKIIELKGLLLSKKGLVNATHPNCDKTEHYLQFCHECLKALEKGKNNLSYNAPPPHAIANHLFIGYMPDNLFNDATWVEHAMTSLVTNLASTRIVRGGTRRAIRSHVLVFGAVPGPPVTLLPRKLDDDAHFRVILAGPFTNSQMDRIRQQHLVRQSMCNDLVNFYKKNNHLYRYIKIDRIALRKLPEENNPDDMFDKINEIDIPLDTIDLIDIQQQRVNDRSSSTNSTDECETMIIEKTVVFIDTAVDKSVLSSKAAKEPIFTVHASNIFVNKDEIAKMFPHLFPYGRGHPNELRRRVKLSPFECAKHYLMLSSRRFAHDKYFTLAVFDRLSMANAYTHVSVRTKQKPQFYRNFNTVEVLALDEALKKKELQRRGRNSDTANAASTNATDESKTADALLRSVEISCINVWGSNEERKRCRREAFSIVGKFGQPALFITLTPNTDNGMLIAYYSGITGLNSLFDLEFKDMPDQFHLETIAMKDYCASARLYDRTINTFLTTALGWDPVFKRPLIEGGLFGHVRAYYGMTETQGSATLHCHLLVWLYGPPMTTIQYDAQTDEEKIDFNKNLESFADSIVSNTLPSRPDLVSCSQCKESFAFDPLPVKSMYRLKRHSKQKKSDSLNGGIREPLLAKCKYCNSKVSAQHLIRRSLIDCRPKDWPVLSERPTSELPMTLLPLTSIELENRYIAERQSRVSLEEAKFYVNDRERIRQNSEPDNIIQQSNDYIAQTFLSTSENPILLFDETSRATSNVKDNVVDRDDLFKYFSLMPPSLDDGRLPVEYSTFIISALAAVFQGHYWQHCPSCFKFSKRTNSSKTCRYAYPKDRVSETNQDKKGIVLKRLLGHEYINSFNDVMLQTFRCNHDIQILIGGVEMAEVMLYCTKYTTKPQHEAYSSTALAVASYRRRLEREKAAATSKSLTKEEMSRKRVTGLMYTMTNSMEIAGTLAALYILRNSPSYRSHDFQSLQLDSIIKWIIPPENVTSENMEEETIDLVKALSFSKTETKSDSGSSSENDSSDSDVTVTVTVTVKVIVTASVIVTVIMTVQIK